MPAGNLPAVGHAGERAAACPFRRSGCLRGSGPELP